VGEVELGRVTPTSLEATVAGERFDPSRHETQPEVKAVTRHELVVEQTEGRWRAEVLFDV
jgi:SHS2 domain-containing protein